MQNIYKIYSLLGYEVEMPDGIIRKDGKVGRFYRVKFNNYKESKEQTSKGVEDVDIDYYDNDNELPF